MNKTLTICLLLAATAVMAQNDKKDAKTIEVKGTAELEVVPDEIYVRIVLKEYKDGGKKIILDKLEEGLVKAVSNLGIPKEDLRVENVFGHNWNWRKRKSEEFLASKSFRLKVKEVKFMNDLMERIDDKGVNNVSIAQVSHSKIEEYNRDLKLKALKAAKDKAKFLLAGIDETLGGALEIQEIDYGYVQQPVYRAAVANVAESALAGGYQSDLEFKTIKLRSEIRAVFEIK